MRDQNSQSMDPERTALTVKVRIEVRGEINPTMQRGPLNFFLSQSQVEGGKKILL